MMIEREREELIVNERRKRENYMGRRA